MNRLKALLQPAWRDAGMELSALFLITTVATIQWLEWHWLMAMLAAPFLIGAGLLVLMLAVHLLWLIVVGIDRLGRALGIRKSPLS